MITVSHPTNYNPRSISNFDAFLDEVRAQRVRDRYGWGVRIVLALALIGFCVVFTSSWVSTRFSGSEIVFAATVLGVSIAFTGVLVPCVFLTLMRRDYVVEMQNEMEAIEGHLKRGREHEAAIQKYESEFSSR